MKSGLHAANLYNFVSDVKSRYEPKTVAQAINYSSFLHIC